MSKNLHKNFKSIGKEEWRWKKPTNLANDWTQKLAEQLKSRIINEQREIITDKFK